MKTLMTMIALLILSVSSACASVQTCPWTYEETRDVQCVSTSDQSMATFMDDVPVTCEVDMRYVNIWDENQICNADGRGVVWSSFDFPAGGPELVLDHTFTIDTTTLWMAGDIADLQNVIAAVGIDLRMNCYQKDTTDLLYGLYCFSGKNSYNKSLGVMAKKIQKQKDRRK